MPLSEADFYAYSRATGTPVPRDAQERAEIAPQVVGFRQGQLSATKEELDQGNFIDTAGKTALLAGLGAGAIALGTGGRFGRLRESLANRVRPKDKGATTGVKTADLNVPAKSFDPPDERMGQLFKSLEYVSPKGEKGPLYIPEPTKREQRQFELSKAFDKANLLNRPTKSKEEAYALAVQRRPLRSAAEQEYVPDIQGESQSKEVYLTQSQQQRQDLEDLRSSRGDRQLEIKGPEFKSNISQLLKDSGTEAIFPVRDPYKTTSSQLSIDFSPRSYLESTGAVAPAPSSTLRKGKDPVDVLLEERELAAQRNRAQAIRAQEAKVIGKGERLLAEIQAETLVEKQNARRPLVSEQSVEAVDTGADQQTARVMQSLQRNEDLDLGQIEVMEDMARQSYLDARQQPAPQEFADAAINEVAASLPDGLPIDQAEGVTSQYSKQDTIAYIRQQNQQRRAELEARGLRGTRLERALAQPYVTKANVQLKSTGPTISETTLSKEYRKVVPSTEMARGVDEEGNIIFGNVAQRTVANVGPEAEITQTAAGTAIRGKSPSYEEAFPVQKSRQLEGPFEEQIPDVTNPIPVTSSLRTGNISRLSVQPVAEEFNPGAGIGIYGVEPGYVPGPTSATASRKPTDVPFKSKKQGFEALDNQQLSNFISNAPEGRVKEAGKKEFLRRQRSQTSVTASEIMRRARMEGRDPNDALMQYTSKIMDQAGIKGRDPNMVLKQYGFNV